MPTNLEKLRGLLQELFQLDQADLDFGIYRIMNQKRDEIVRFLDKDLLPQVKEAFGQYKSADKSALQTELDKLVATITSAGMNPDESPKVKALRQHIAESAVDVTALENEVFSHLFNFFRRYYSDGDFISQRRYKEGVYAIPYEGEEVKLHWANADQYYVKSSEAFRDYTFRLTSGKRVKLHLVAASTEQDNNKAAPGTERRFILCGDKPLVLEDDGLSIRFEYRIVNGTTKQSQFNQEAAAAILSAPGFDPWIAELRNLAPTESQKQRTVLEKHLTQYTARNTFDFFIHKDLGRFLRLELDFYIKNEVMHLDDIENESAPRVEQYLSQIRVIRTLAHKVIAFLEQLENFQKKMWLKKRFVVESNYCITLDRVPEALYPEIIANEAQRHAWERLFAIDAIQGDLSQPGYSVPLTIEFLKSQPFLVLDTQHFSRPFRDRLLSSISDLASSVGGVLIHSENFLALNLLRNLLRHKIECIYIDPPYNTGIDGFLYKDNYQHASWLSLMFDRLQQAETLMSHDAALFVSMDESEEELCRCILSEAFGRDSHVGTIIWKKRGGPPNDRVMASVHENIFVVQRHDGLADLALLPRSDESKARYTNDDNDPNGPWVAGDLSANAKGGRFVQSLYYDIENPVSKQKHLPPEGACWRFNKEKVERLIREGQVFFGSDGQGRPKLKRYLKDVRDGVTIPSIWDDVPTGTTARTEINELFGENNAFDTVKPVGLLQRILSIAAHRRDSYVLDFFGGSGTTAHATIEQNRIDNGNRKYTLVEVGAYFDTVLRPRIMKCVYSRSWKSGKPVGRDGSSHCFKYMRLESYEDSLNNLELRRTERQATLLDAGAEMREQYILSYMLDVESRGSQSLLNVESFRNPDEYKLRVERNGETILVNVDLVETFNLLLGLTVRHIDVIRNVRVVEGTNPQGERVLILWRNIDTTDNDSLDKWFTKQDYNTREMVYDLFYVNGDNNLENLRRSDQTWKVRLIEEEFQRLMFDVQDA